MAKKQRKFKKEENENQIDIEGAIEVRKAEAVVKDTQDFSGLVKHLNSIGCQEAARHVQDGTRSAKDVVNELVSKFQKNGKKADVAALLQSMA